VYTYWKKLTHEEIKERVFNALQHNINYDSEAVLGIPASYLDGKVFSQDDSFLQNAPYISTLVKNPNHIGCHTLGKSESYFKGTQELEKELLNICAVDVLKADPDSFDGYVASGGTEANMQAIWLYRNYFKQECKASLDEIAILCSADSHYSMDKAANLLSIPIYKTPVGEEDRELDLERTVETIKQAKAKGVQHFIVVVNMMTTMFGSVDNIDVYLEALHQTNANYKLHVDGAYGGFYYPFTKNKGRLTFQNEAISSFTLDAHKMAQAPYGTGIFLCRKNLIHYTNTKTGYVEGDDYTLIGSRSGANAVAVWMILGKNGPFGWHEKVMILQKRAEWMCKQMKLKGIEYYSHPYSNIITIKACCLDRNTARRFGLVPDNHNNPHWYKIVLMEHVTIEKLIPLLQELHPSKEKEVELNV
jgi:tyrosine decarboxylase/aspartate 1-decarboxylase